MVSAQISCHDKSYAINNICEPAHLEIHLYFKGSDASNIILRKLIAKIYSSSPFILCYIDTERI